MSEDELKEEIARVMRALYERKLVSAEGGNVSARFPGSKEIWITPSGTFKGGMKAGDLLKIDLDGKVIAGSGKPSKEWVMHAAAYKKRPDVNAVVHAHNPITVGMTLAGIEIKPVNIEAAAALRRVPVIPLEIPGTKNVGASIGANAENAQAIIIRNHGVVAMGRNLLEAEAITEMLEENALARLVSILAGKKEMEKVPEKIVETTRKLYDL